MITRTDRDSNRWGLYLSLFFPVILLISELIAHPKLARFFFFIGVAGAVIRYLYWNPSNVDKQGGKADLNWLKHQNLLEKIDLIRMQCRGHDGVIRQLILEIQKKIALVTEDRCLGSFLLVGPAGTGKMMLARLIAENLFPTVKPFIHLFENPSQDALSFSTTVSDALLENPFRVIILDNIDQGGTAVFKTISSALHSGFWTDPRSGKKMSLAGCLFLGISEGGTRVLRQVVEKKQKNAGGSAVDGVLESKNAFSDELKLDRQLVSAWDRVCFLEALSPTTMAEVACLQIGYYFLSYGIDVDFVAPQLIGVLVAPKGLISAQGARELSQAIKSWCEEAVLRARAQGLTSVRLDLDSRGEVRVSSAQQYERVRAA